MPLGSAPVFTEVRRIGHQEAITFCLHSPQKESVSCTVIKTKSLTPGGRMLARRLQCTPRVTFYSVFSFSVIHGGIVKHPCSKGNWWNAETHTPLCTRTHAHVHTCARAHTRTRRVTSLCPHACLRVPLDHGDKFRAWEFLSPKVRAS